MRIQTFVSPFSNVHQKNHHDLTIYLLVHLRGKKTKQNRHHNLPPGLMHVTFKCTNCKASHDRELGRRIFQYVLLLCCQKNALKLRNSDTLTSPKRTAQHGCSVYHHWVMTPFISHKYSFCVVKLVVQMSLYNCQPYTSSWVALMLWRVLSAGIDC